ncbi:MAG: tetratricopeptide repeat protein [Chloroflexi bacterium]|nr:tetratricopeptide repeat protein [Chloroflexota bacterium]
MRENLNLVADVLTLLGAFTLGYIVGRAWSPIAGFLRSIGTSPGRLARGARIASARLRQAFSLPPAGEEPDRSTFKGFIAGTLSDILTFRLRRADEHFRQGMAAFDRGEYEAARELLTSAMDWDWNQELKPLHVQAHLRLGWLAEADHAFRSAKAHYEKAVRLEPDNLQATVSLATVLFQLGETAPAIFHFQRALELDPNNLETHYYLYAIYRRLKMEREAIEQLRILKAGENAETLSELFSRHGDDHFQLDRLDEAISDYQLAMQFSPHDCSLYTRLGDAYYQQDQPRMALETWLRGIWLGFSYALEERLLTVCADLGESWTVIQVLRDAAGRHPNDGRYNLTLSKLFEIEGVQDEVLAQAQEAVRRSPDLLEAHERLGAIYEAAKDYQAAQDTYRTALASARSQETVYRCAGCGFISRQDQDHCFQCGRWYGFQATTRGEAGAKALVPRQLMDQTSQSIQRVWGDVRSHIKRLTSGV